MAHRSDSRGEPIYSSSYWDIPIQTEKKRQYLSEFQTKNLLNEQIDYLLKQENWIPTDWEKTTEYGSPFFNYGQKIRNQDPDAGYFDKYNPNKQSLQNIWRIHGYPEHGGIENTGLGDYAKEMDIPINRDILDSIYGEERREPNMQGNKAPNWDYIDALEQYRDSYGNLPQEDRNATQQILNSKEILASMDPAKQDEYIQDIVDRSNAYKIGIMNTGEVYQDIDKGSEEANIGGVNVGEKVTGTGGKYTDYSNIVLNPANVVKKYPTAPMGPDSEWEFFLPEEQNMKIGRLDDNWNQYRIIPHETGHHKARIDKWYAGKGAPNYRWDDPNPGAYLEGTKEQDDYSDFNRHPLFHTMDSLLHGGSNMSLSKTQYQNFQHNQERAMEQSLMRENKEHPDDFRNALAQSGHWGSGRSRIENTGRPMYQSASSRAIEPTLPPSTAPDRSPRRHHFNTGGITGLPGQWTPSMSESEEEEYNIRPLQLDPGIMSIEDLEDLFEEVGLDKSIIRKLINSGGLSQLLS